MDCPIDFNEDAFDYDDRYEEEAHIYFTVCDFSILVKRYGADFVVNEWQQTHPETLNQFRIALNNVAKTHIS